MSNKPDYAALVGSRICHDLISPVGAISNGLELFELAGSVAGPEMQLIGDSVANASARIRFFRVAFGQASSDQMVGESEILSILDSMASGGRIGIDWAVTGPVERADLRRAFLALMCFELAMPFGGVVTVSRSDNGWRFDGESEKLRLDAPMWEIITSGVVPTDIAPSQVQFGLLYEDLAAVGLKPALNRSATQIELVY